MGESAHECVVIIGASLAGVSTAIALARTGIGSILVDKSTFPRRKPCGEGLSARGLAELAALGVSLESLGIEAVPLGGYRIFAGGRELVIPDRVGLVGVSRHTLDAALIDFATSLPQISLQLGDGISGIKCAKEGFVLSLGRREIVSRLVVIADGAQSPSLRMLGESAAPRFSKRFGSSSTWRVEVGALGLAVHTFFVDGGEVYVTPLSHGRVNISVLGDRALVQKASVPRLLKDLLTPIGRTLGVTLKPLAPPIGSGVVESRYNRATCKGAFVVGDACETFDPCAGFGMTHALLSGRIAAKHLTSVALGGDLAAAALRYDQERTQQVQDIRGFTRLTSFMMGNAIGRLSFPIAVRSGLAERASRSVHGRAQGSVLRKFCALVG